MRYKVYREEMPIKDGDVLIRLIEIGGDIYLAVVDSFGKPIESLIRFDNEYQENVLCSPIDQNYVFDLDNKRQIKMINGEDCKHYKKKKEEMKSHPLFKMMEAAAEMAKEEKAEETPVVH
jgi:hypothetical protein